MKTKIPLIAAAICILIIIAGAGIMLLHKSSSSSSNAMVSQTPTTMPSKTADAKQTLMNLISSGKSLQCTYSFSPNGSNVVSKGIIYISGGKMRADYNVTSSGVNISASMIRDADYTYVFGKTLPMAIKMKNSDAMGQPMPSGAGQSQLDVNQAADYSCSDWTVDASKFALPQGVTFQDMSAMMPKGSGTPVMPTGSTSMQVACNACNSLTGEQQTACRQQLHCQ